MGGAGGGFFELPLRLNMRENVEVSASVLVSVSPLVTLSVVKLLAIKNILDSLSTTVKWRERKVVGGYSVSSESSGRMTSNAALAAAASADLIEWPSP